MRLVCRTDGVEVRTPVEVMGEQEEHIKQMSYDELEEHQPEIVVRSVRVERNDDGSLKNIHLSDESEALTTEDVDSGKVPQWDNIQHEREILDSEGFNEEFAGFVIDWFDLTTGTARADNVTGVVIRIRDKGKVNKSTWNEAVKERVNAALKEDPSRDRDSYHYSVRDACTRQQGYKGDGAVNEFLNDVRQLLREWEETA